MNWRQRLAAGWQRFLAWQRQNRDAHAKSGTGNCCANPSNVYAARRKKP